MDTIKRLARIRDAIEKRNEPHPLEYDYANRLLDEAIALLLRPIAELSTAERSCRLRVLACPALSPDAPPRSTPPRDLSRWTLQQLVTYRAKLMKLIDLVRSVQ